MVHYGDQFWQIQKETMQFSLNNFFFLAPQELLSLTELELTAI